MIVPLTILSLDAPATELLITSVFNNFPNLPGYTLGNLYAAQLLEAMEDELGDIDEIIESGEWQPMLDWLRSKIHLQGSKWTPSELIENATGAPPTPQPFITYVERKYGELYNL